MVTPLDRPLRRIVMVDGEPYVVTVDAEGVRVVRKGHRKGHQVSWQDILSGEVTLGAQLRRSLERERPPSEAPRKASESTAAHDTDDAPAARRQRKR